MWYGCFSCLLCEVKVVSLSRAALHLRPVAQPLDHRLPVDDEQLLLLHRRGDCKNGKGKILRRYHRLLARTPRQILWHVLVIWHGTSLSYRTPPFTFDACMSFVRHVHNSIWRLKTSQFKCNDILVIAVSSIITQIHIWTLRRVLCQPNSSIGHILPISYLECVAASF